ncbi:MAG: Ig-like domain-containing protein [Bacteroidota bacterium]
MRKVSRTLCITSIATLLFSCVRDEEPLPAATFPTTAEVFTDVPVGLTDEFFISFDPAGGANTDGFGTDDSEAFEETTSIRIEVPSATNADGSFIGGIFRDRGAGRNLTGYDALTFWAKASTTATLGTVGFGTDFIENKFPVSRSNLELSTDWKQYIIPIPDASKLTQERGLFLFSAGSQSTGGNGYTLWLDEIKFENLGTLAQDRPSILGGQQVLQEGFLEVPVQITNLTQTLNSADGDITVSASPLYFDFTSSNETVAVVDEMGLVQVRSIGEATITAKIGNTVANGSLNLNVEGGFVFAQAPTLEASKVVSLFSDAYNDIPVSRYNSFFEPFQTTLGGVLPVGSESIISYTNMNFVGIVFNDVTFPAEAVAPIDATNLTHLHFDINVQEEIQPGDFIEIELSDYNSDPALAARVTISASQLLERKWASIDIPLSDFTALTSRSRVGLLLFDSDKTISDIYLDNIYFYDDTE